MLLCVLRPLFLVSLFHDALVILDLASKIVFEGAQTILEVHLSYCGVVRVLLVAISRPWLTDRLMLLPLDSSRYRVALVDDSRSLLGHLVVLVRLLPLCLVGYEGGIDCWVAVLLKRLGSVL